jgi:diketogulonate reductase-like aldo/keto reductase
MIMTSKIPLLTLNNGVEMPALGLGVLGRESRELTAGAVEAALTCGCRLIDTAASYLNERDVGEGIRRSGVARSEVFVTTKLWLSDYGYDRALFAFDSALRKLGFDYLDLFLLHWPVPSAFDATAESWRAAERLLAEGRARAIGVANFSVAHLDMLAQRSDVKPAVNQVELHPMFQQPQLQAEHRRRGIVTQAWSPLGGSVRMFRDRAGTGDPLEHPTVMALASKYSKTPAQIVLRWHIESGNSAIPKSFRPERIAQNIDVFDFELSAEDCAAINALDAGRRSGPDPDTVQVDTFPLQVQHEARP